MKRLILNAIVLIGLAYSAQAQGPGNAKNAIGLRVGDNDGFGVEASYQRKLSESNRLEIDLGVRNHRFDDRRFNNGYYDSSSVKLVGLYQWVWNIEGGFNWYVGVGGGIASYNNKDRRDNEFNHPDSGVYALAAGDIGIEYNFDFPLQLSLDFRPELGFGDYYDHNNISTFGPDIAVSGRWRF